MFRIFPSSFLLLFSQVGRGSGSALPSSGMHGNKVNLGGLLTSLRELSAHVSGGYGWPACADRVAPLCGRFVRLWFWIVPASSLAVLPPGLAHPFSHSSRFNFLYLSLSLYIPFLLTLTQLAPALG